MPKIWRPLACFIFSGDQPPGKMYITRQEGGFTVNFCIESGTQEVPCLTISSRLQSFFLMDTFLIFSQTYA